MRRRTRATNSSTTSAPTSTTTPGSSWTATLDTVGGLAYTVNFAKAHGKFASVPEWGLNGADDAAFINDMYGFITNPNNDVGYSSYFSYDGVVNSDITQFPNSAAAFGHDFV